MNGYVYFLTNPAFSNLVKIGFTRGEVDVRAQQLYATGVPYKFNVAAFFAVSNAAECESRVHSIFSDIRANAGREFFEGNLANLIKESFERVICDYVIGGVEQDQPLNHEQQRFIANMWHNDKTRCSYSVEEITSILERKHLKVDVGQAISALANKGLIQVVPQGSNTILKLTSSGQEMANPLPMV